MAEPEAIWIGTLPDVPGVAYALRPWPAVAEFSGELLANMDPAVGHVVLPAHAGGGHWRPASEWARPSAGCLLYMNMANGRAVYLLRQRDPHTDLYAGDLKYSEGPRLDEVPVELQAP